jgi:iron complex transport system permease protein
VAAVAAPRPPSVVVSVTDTPAGPAVRHAAAVDAYHAIVRRRLGLLAALSLAVVCALVLDVATGPSNLPLRDTLQLLLQRGAADSASAVIVWEVRLPQALMALCVGAALALAGTEMQTSLNNPLASPFTLGMSSAAILGAALAIVLEISLPGVPTHWVIPANAFAFALVAVFLLQAAAARQRGGAETLVLLGIALYFTFNALVAITQFLASEQALQQLVFWTMGSLGRASWTEVRLLAVVLLLVAPWSWRASWRLTALRLGDERARSLAVDVRTVRTRALLRVSVLTATAVSFVGTIAFVGLVGPHIGRMLIGEDHRFLLPASALAGALILSLASTASKTIVTGAVVPIGLVTALIGVPFFVWLVWRREAL